MSTLENNHSQNSLDTKKKYKKKAKFILSVTTAVLVTFILGLYVANLLFGKNSVEVYNSLKNKKIQLETEIRKLQLGNAKLQKEYFELKNLEPEER